MQPCLSGCPIEQSIGGSSRRPTGSQAKLVRYGFHHRRLRVGGAQTQGHAVSDGNKGRPGSPSNRTHFATSGSLAGAPRQSCSCSIWSPPSVYTVGPVRWRPRRAAMALHDRFSEATWTAAARAATIAVGAQLRHAGPPQRRRPASQVSALDGRLAVDPQLHPQLSHGDPRQQRAVYTPRGRRPRRSGR